jgi:hypothetical protein
MITIPACPWIPAGEYWLDSCNVAEAAYNLIHETVEDRAMRDDGLSYAEAHSKRANPAEYEARQNPDKTAEILRELGWSV